MGVILFDFFSSIGKEELKILNTQYSIFSDGVLPDNIQYSILNTDRLFTSSFLNLNLNLIQKLIYPFHT
jgi:hypothetical protein